MHQQARSHITPAPPHLPRHPSQLKLNNHLTQFLYLVHPIEPKLHEGRDRACLSHHRLPAADVYFLVCVHLWVKAQSGDTKAFPTLGCPSILFLPLLDISCRKEWCAAVGQVLESNLSPATASWLTLGKLPNLSELCLPLRAGGETDLG